MKTLTSRTLQSVLILSLLFVFNTFKIHAQSEISQVKLDTLDQFQPPHAVKFNYLRIEGNDSPSIVLYSQPFSFGEGGSKFLKYTLNDEIWTSETLEPADLLTGLNHYMFDFDRDGFDDIVVVSEVGAEIEVLLFRHKGEIGSLEYEPPVLLKNGIDSQLSGLLIRDLNNDGFEDLISNNYDWIGINNRGKGLLNYYPLAESNDSYRPVTIFDVNRDGWQDIFFDNVGANGEFFLTKESVFDLSNPKYLSGTPTTLIPMIYNDENNEQQQVISVDTDIEIDMDEQRNVSRSVTFELGFNRIIDNYDVIQDAMLGIGPISFNHETQLKPTVQILPHISSDTTDLVFSFSIDDDKRIRHFLDFKNGEIEITSTDTVGYTGGLPLEIIDNKYIAPRSTQLKWLDEKPHYALVERISGIDIDDVPSLPQNITTNINDNLLTVSWEPSPADSGKNLTYSVYLTNEETGFHYRSDYLVPFPLGYDQYQNRVNNHFKLFENLPSGTYDISIQAVDKFSRRSPKSTPVSVNIENDENPQLPDKVEAKAVDAGIEVSFNMSSYFDSVLVYRSLSESFDDYSYIGKANTYLQSYNDEDVNSSTSYTYALKVFLNGQSSEFTDTVTINTSELHISNVFSLDNSFDRILDIISYDLNLDGYKDLIINAQKNSESNSIYLLPGTEQGFEESNPVILLENEFVQNLRIGDWDGDLQPDLIYQDMDFENWTSPTIIQLLKDLEISETITFDAGTDFNTVNNPELLFVSDLDLNGRTDLVYGGFDHLIVVWNDDSETTFEAITTEGYNTYRAKNLDLNQDGFEDLIVDEGPGSAPVVYINQKEKIFERKTVGLPIYTGNSEAGSYHKYIPMLFDDDMYPDLLVGTEVLFETDSMGIVHTIPADKIYLYNPNTESYEETDFLSSNTVHRPIHFNNDEYVDFIKSKGSGLNILVNDKNTSFTQMSMELSSANSLWKVLQSDTDHDGDQDILFLGYKSSTIFQIENVDEPFSSTPNTPIISEINSQDGGVIIKWGASHWSSNLDSHIGYGVRISNGDQNIMVGNIHPVTGKRGAMSKHSAFQNTRLEIPKLPDGTYSVWVSAYNPLDKSSGFSEAQQFTVIGTNLEWENIEVPEFHLYQNYPNPFNPVTAIKYQIAKPSHVTLEIFDITGRLVQTLVNKNQNTGTYQVSFNGNQIASGIYVYRLKAGDYVSTRKFSLVK